MKEYWVLLGAFGSGKSELALNMSIAAAKKGPCTLVDLDVINPYVRTSERGDVLTPAGGMGVTKHAEYTKEKYGHVLCGACAKKEAIRIKQEAEAKEAQQEENTRAAQQAEAPENTTENATENTEE
jgi:MinD superfamily P-loop ATPase